MTKDMLSPLAYTIPQAADAVGLSVYPIYQAIEKGDLTPRYSGRKPLIIRAELEAWVTGLPVDRPQ